MKKNMIKAMDNLQIDEGIRGLVGKMWKHGYKTLHSCAGHKPQMVPDIYVDKETGEETYLGEVLDAPTRYVVYKKGTGDGWFEENSYNLGFIGFTDGKARDFSTGKRVPAMSYYAKNPYVEHLPNGGVKIHKEKVA